MDTKAGVTERTYCSQVKKNTKNITTSCFDCQFSRVIDMWNDSKLECIQHNTLVDNDGAICSEFIKERWIK